MIPYDDLVVALQTWRARQGLSVAQLAGAPPAQPPAEAPRAAPPVAPPRAAAAAPPPLGPPPDTRDEEVDASLLEEAHYENEGDDFAMAFGGNAEVDESTSIGSAPPPGGRDSFGASTDPEPGSGKHNRNDDW